MSKAVLPSRHHCKRRHQSDQRSQATRREAFHRWLRYEPLEDRCLLSGNGSEVGSIGDKLVNISAPDATAGEPWTTARTDHPLGKHDQPANGDLCRAG